MKHNFGRFITEYALDVNTGLYSTEAETLLKGLLIYLSARSHDIGIPTLDPNGGLKNARLYVMRKGGRKYEYIEPGRSMWCYGKSLKPMKPHADMNTPYEQNEWPGVLVYDFIREPDGEICFHFAGPLYFNEVNEDFTEVTSMCRVYASHTTGASAGGAAIDKLKHRLAYDILEAGQQMLLDFKTEEVNMNVIWQEADFSKHITAAVMNCGKLEALVKALDGKPIENELMTRLKGMPLDVLTSSAIEVMDNMIWQEVNNDNFSYEQMHRGMALIKQRLQMTRNALKQKETAE